MSLSRFYKTNSNFQPKAILESTAPASNEPVWGSIIKEEQPTSEPVPEIIKEPLTPETVSPAPMPEAELPVDAEDSPVLDNTQEDTSESFAEEPKPPEPAIDIETIRENAFTSGIAAGRQQAEEDLDNIAKTFLSMCNELDRLRETILKNSSDEMKELVLAISERIIRHSVKEQEETIIATIQDAIHLAVKSDEFQIQINPADLEVVKSQKEEIISSISGLENIILQADPNIERGGCKLESTCCTVDASMTSQIKVIHDSIMTPETLPHQDESKTTSNS
ncbi:MAG TPA: hypothetical protein EYG88_10725 [Desulfocapsa sulfexigens]|nr:hypothetical protein [Desulfocapsa sulfexigens]